MTAPALDFAPLDKILDEFKGRKDAVIPILQRAQDIYGYLPKEILQAISKKAGIPLSRLYGVATFYAQFHLKRRGRHLVKVCDGTACHVSGAPDYVESLEKEYNLLAGHSSSDYKYTLDVVYCVGACGLAPVVLVNDKVHGKLSPENLIEELNALE
ncbi:MAG: NAD(P)H-dependent oxidoreductase subunit E [Chloroflexi bacterium]|nr:NAD(P)H-dependent oxidoreductase subunit E [Chloroflexota bacterium]